MSSFELNKIFAAILCVGIVIMLLNFVTDKIIIADALQKDAVTIDGAIANNHKTTTASKPKFPDPIMALLANADIERGAKVSKTCTACHSFNKGGATKQGPNLWGIVGAIKSNKSGFSYSKAMIATGGDWGYNELNRFLTKPKKFMPKTKMNFAGLKKAKDRAALIAWLRVQSDDLEALPNEAEIIAEQNAFAPPVIAEDISVNIETVIEESSTSKVPELEVPNTKDHH